MTMPAYRAPTPQAALDVSLGPERYVYERLIFGSSSTKGVPEGDFYDFRGYPVPYTPDQPTDITLTLPEDSAVIGQNLKVELFRDDPKVYPAYEAVRFAPSSAVTSFGARMDQGLNYVKITTESGDVLASIAISATRVATVMYAIAVDIYTSIWQPIDATAKEIFDTHTGLFSNLVEFLDLLPQESSRHLLANYLAVRALVPKAGTEEGLNNIIQALFDQTPVYRTVQESDWNAGWLRPNPPTTMSQAGREAHLWSYDAVASRILQFGRLCKNMGKDVLHDKYGATSGNLQYDWRRYLDKTERQPRTAQKKRYDGHVTSIATKVALTFPWVSGQRSIVQFPGLWDSQIPYFDQGTQFDSSRFDFADTSGPLGFKGWVGVPVIPPPTFGEAASEGRSSMSALIAVEESAELQQSLSLKGIEEVVTVEWGSNAFGLVSATPAGTDWVETQHAAVAPSASNDPLAVVSSKLRKTSSSTHAHTMPLMTIGQWKSILNGGVVQLTSNYDHDRTHSHIVSIYLKDLEVVVDINDNHGHLADVTPPSGQFAV